MAKKNDSIDDNKKDIKVLKIRFEYFEKIISMIFKSLHGKEDN
jgi:hypothetical protein